MDDLIADFIAETSESLQELDSEMILLEQDPNNPELVGSIFRLLHTIKGTCGFLGLSRLETVAHAGENILGRVRDGELEITQTGVSLILEAFDVIRDILEHLSENTSEPEGDDTDLKNRLNHYAQHGDSNEGAADNTESEANSDDAADANASISEDSLDMSLEAFDENIAASQEEDSHKAEGESISDESASESASSASDEEAPKAPTQQEEAKPQSEPAPSKEDKPAAAEKQNKKAAQQNLRVNINVLEDLMQMVSELVLTRNQLLQLVRNNSDTEFATPLQRLSYITSELQEGVMKTRMQPIGNAWSQFPRIVRDLSLDLNKKIELHQIGAETELDRQLLEMIKDPLTHMVRNSCDHGLEIPQERVAAGKNEKGNVTLQAYHEGGHIIIEIADDGKGVNVERVKQKIIENGLASAEDLEVMPEQQIIQYIFKAGFSTAEKVTNVSGRGVGMDVVRTNIEKIGGTVELRSKTGVGSTFFIKIPLTLAIVSVLIVESKRERFAIPQINIEEMVRVSSNQNSNHQIENIHGSPVLRLRERLLPLISLAQVLNLQDKADQKLQADNFIVICKVGAFEFGVMVDRVFDTEEIVVKPVAPVLQKIDLYSGSTILGDGSVIMILDPNGLSNQVGEIQIPKENKEANKDSVYLADKLISFLVFDSGGKSPMAVPLEQVSRLEEIPTENIELSGGKQVVQYREGMMYLAYPTGMYDLPEAELQQVIVFNQDERVMGLVVNNIIDVVEAHLRVIPNDTTGQLGSMVISGKTTDIIDVGHYITETFGSLAHMLYDESEYGDPAVERHIMLVEDSSFFRNLLEPILNMEGYRVTTAEDGLDAIKKIDQGVGDLDLIITDIDMPNMDGFEFAEECRNRPILSQVPMIAFTANALADSIRRGNTTGFKEYVTKTDQRQLLEAVERVIHSSSDEDNQASASDGFEDDIMMG